MRSAILLIVLIALNALKIKITQKDAVNVKGQEQDAPVMTRSLKASKAKPKPPTTTVKPPTTKPPTTKPDPIKPPTTKPDPIKPPTNVKPSTSGTQPPKRENGNDKPKQPTMTDKTKEKLKELSAKLKEKGKEGGKVIGGAGKEIGKEIGSTAKEILKEQARQLTTDVLNLLIGQAKQAITGTTTTGTTTTGTTTTGTTTTGTGQATDNAEILKVVIQDLDDSLENGSIDKDTYTLMKRQAIGNLTPPKFTIGSCIYSGFENVSCGANSIAVMYKDEETKRCTNNEFGSEIPVGKCRFKLNKNSSFLLNKKLPLLKAFYLI